MLQIKRINLITAIRQVHKNTEPKYVTKPKPKSSQTQTHYWKTKKPESVSISGRIDKYFRNKRTHEEPVRYRIRRDMMKLWLGGVVLFDIVPRVCLQSQIEDFFSSTANDNNNDDVAKMSKLRTLLSEVCKDLQMPDEKVSKLNVFMMDRLGHDSYPFHSSSVLPNGKLGLPYYISYDDVSEVDLANLKHIQGYPKIQPFLNQITIELKDLVSDDKEGKDINDDDIEKLKKTFVLSESAKKFCLASHVDVFESKFIDVMRTIALTLNGFMVIAVTKIKNNHKKIRGKPFFFPWHTRVLHYLVYLILLVGSCELIYVMARACQDKRADNFASTLGIEYAEGGIGKY